MLLENDIFLLLFLSLGTIRIRVYKMFLRNPDSKYLIKICNISLFTGSRCTGTYVSLLRIEHVFSLCIFQRNNI